MDALNAIKIQLSKSEKLSLTENGDTAYKSTGSACLDFFSLCGAMRKNISDLVKLFTKAYAENPVIAVKNSTDEEEISKAKLSKLPSGE